MISTEFNGLIPADYGDNLTLFTCWTTGQRVGEVKLDDVVPDKSILKQTISHCMWGSVEEVTEKNDLVLKRVDGKRLRFKIDSCKRAEQTVLRDAPARHARER